MNKWIEEAAIGTQFVAVYTELGGKLEPISTNVYQREERGVFTVSMTPFEFDFEDFGPDERFITLDEMNQILKDRKQGGEQ